MPIRTLPVGNDLALRFECVTDGHYETPDGTWTIRHEAPRLWVAEHDTDEQVAYGRTLRIAAALVAHRLTRYRYRVPLGEQCAVCGDTRGIDTAGIDWWWHTACRGPHDPEGKAHALTTGTWEAVS